MVAGVGGANAAAKSTSASSTDLKLAGLWTTMLFTGTPIMLLMLWLKLLLLLKQIGSRLLPPLPFPLMTVAAATELLLPACWCLCRVCCAAVGVLSM